MIFKYILLILSQHTSTTTTQATHAAELYIKSHDVKNLNIRNKHFSALSTFQIVYSITFTVINRLN